MHGNLQDVEEMKQILEDEKLEEKEGAIGKIALLEGEYVYRTQRREDEFDFDSDRGIWPARGLWQQFLGLERYGDLPRVFQQQKPSHSQW